ncbi:MAG: glycosyltransferase, partial [Polyangiales bacterium]
VGTFSLQKGADTLVEACSQLDDVRLLHVGAVEDVAFPIHPRFEHHAPVDQRALPDFFQRAHALALPSRQDGFGLVLSQALAIGLPVVGTTETGAPDLAEMLPGARHRVTVIPPEDVSALRDALAAAVVEGQTRHALTPDESAALSWTGYARRYERELQKLV